MSAAAERLREYEIIYVLSPNADNTEAERINAKVSEVITNFGGTLLKLDNWGRRKLAYPIKRKARGIFVYAKYIAQPGAVAEMERNLRIADSVLRYQSSLLNPEVETGELSVDPEDVTFSPVTAAEPEEELTYEQRLGLAPTVQRRAPVETNDDDANDSGDSDDGNGEKPENERGGQ